MVDQRLPPDVRSEAISVLASRSTDVPERLRPAFVAFALSGYQWGGEVSVYAVLTSAANDIMGEFAERYGERSERSEVVADAAMVATRMKLICVEGSSPFGSADEAYDAKSESLLDTFGLAGVDSPQLRGAFHIGAALFAGESALIEALSWQENSARGEASARRSARDSIVEREARTEREPSASRLVHALVPMFSLTCGVAAFAVLSETLWWVWALLLCVPIGLVAWALPFAPIDRILRNLRPEKMRTVSYLGFFAMLVVGVGSFYWLNAWWATALLVLLALSIGWYSLGLFVQAEIAEIAPHATAVYEHDEIRQAVQRRMLEHGITIDYTEAIDLADAWRNQDKELGEFLDGVAKEIARLESQADS
jgi:hypothetical protein